MIISEKDEKIERLRAEVSELRKDAERYRWLKSRTGLVLRSESNNSIWTRIDGSRFTATHYLAEGQTQHAPSDGLDATIDAAMSEQALQEMATDNQEMGLYDV